jgi:hypothetical protein
VIPCRQRGVAPIPGNTPVSATQTVPTPVEPDPATPPPSRERSTVRLPLLFLTDGPLSAPALLDPRLNAGANADLYHALPTAAGRGFAYAHHALPVVDRWYVRAAEVGALTLGIVPFSVYMHEAGHYERAMREGYESSITMTGLASGYTQYSYGRIGPPDARTDLAISLAGVNQEEFNSETIYRNATVLDNGRVNWATGLAYLIARTNSPGYQVRSMLLSTPAPGDDMFEWGRWLESSGNPFSLGGSAALSTAAALASPMTALSVYGGLRYIFTGDPTVEIPSLRLGPVALQAPDLHVYLHPEGPLLEGRTALRHDASGMSAELHAFGEVGGSVGGVGVAVNEIPVVRGLTVSSRAAFSGGRPGFGFDVGAGLNYDFNHVVGLSANVGFMNNYPLAEATGRRTGVSGDLGLRLSF